MKNPNIVSIHGKEYMTVAGRLEVARKDLKSIDTEIISHDTMVIVKATVTTDKGTFTGISAANPAKQIEKASPYEVAETSAVGRALGFAGYGVIDGIATADEMVKATTEQSGPISTGACEYEGCTIKGFKPEIVEESLRLYGKVLCFAHRPEGATS